MNVLCIYITVSTVELEQYDKGLESMILIMKLNDIDDHRSVVRQSECQ